VHQLFSTFVQIPNPQTKFSVLAAIGEIYEKNMKAFHKNEPTFVQLNLGLAKDGLLAVLKKPEVAM